MEPTQLDAWVLFLVMIAGERAFREQRNDLREQNRELREQNHVLTAQKTNLREQARIMETKHPVKDNFQPSKMDKTISINP